MNQFYFNINRHEIYSKTVKFSLIDYSLRKLTRYPVVGIGWFIYEHFLQI